MISFQFSRMTHNNKVLLRYPLNNLSRFFCLYQLGLNGVLTSRIKYNDVNNDTSLSIIIFDFFLEEYGEYIIQGGEKGFISIPFPPLRAEKAFKFFYNVRTLLFRSKVFKYYNELNGGNLIGQFVYERTADKERYIKNGVMCQRPRIHAYSYLKKGSDVKRMIWGNKNILLKKKFLNRDSIHLSHMEMQLLFIRVNIDFLCYVLDIWTTMHPEDFKENLLDLLRPFADTPNPAIYYLINLKDERPVPGLWHANKDKNASIKNHWFATRAYSRGVAIVPQGFFDT